MKRETFDITFEDGAKPEPHELDTAFYFIKTGKQVKFLAPINQNRVKTPDIEMDGLKWEIKSPVNAGKRTMEEAFRQALKQSPNIVFDLRRSRASDTANVRNIERQIKLVRGKELKRVIVITKKQQRLDLK